jgi:hypothetical protein
MVPHPDDPTGAHRRHLPRYIFMRVLFEKIRTVGISTLDLAFAIAVYTAFPAYFGGGSSKRLSRWPGAFSPTALGRLSMECGLKKMRIRRAGSTAASGRPIRREGSPSLPLFKRNIRCFADAPPRSSMKDYDFPFGGGPLGWAGCCFCCNCCCWDACFCCNC